MKLSLKKRLLRLEAPTLSSRKKHRVARILCGPDVMRSIDAEVLLILPDNGCRFRGNQKVPKGSYLGFYS